MQNEIPLEGIPINSKLELIDRDQGHSWSQAGWQLLVGGERK